ncbi:S4 domain-containing protein YaaA [Brevibacillus sp. SYP-B805]|jgi:ribosome-associated protein|uniref:S4 domain-containing protein YaaA n=1 Tax=Brevibacillus sp. SYP-B805 TaxID=1578199 RepID=UPI0013EB2989|nr:S4 domain-containing protein YaaA [Brevibacillus sp. SYP-B805]NGQ96550.1 S4 domain-containing protein YaaA [Brevibacillus sp. SYP-B805]
MNRTVPIRTEYIALGQFLKLADVIDTGGMAKAFLAEVPIKVNGERENRRGRKLYPEDVVEIEGHGLYKITRG